MPFKIHDLRLSCLHRTCQRSPRLTQKLVDSVPILFRNAALFGLVIANRHRFSAQAAVFHQTIHRHAINLSLQFRQGFIQIPQRMLGALAMYDPPLEFQPRGAIDSRTECRSFGESRCRTSPDRAKPSRNPRAAFPA